MGSRGLGFRGLGFKGAVYLGYPLPELYTECRTITVLATVEGLHGTPKVIKIAVLSQESGYERVP